jgi:hypothetical protein
VLFGEYVAMTNTETSCRDLIDWGALVGAALGLPYRKVFECLNGTMGQVYGVVTARQTLPVVIGMAPNGGLAHYTRFWGTSPQVGARWTDVPLHAAAAAITLPTDSGGAMMGTKPVPLQRDLRAPHPRDHLRGRQRHHA